MKATGLYATVSVAALIAVTPPAAAQTQVQTLPAGEAPVAQTAQDDGIGDIVVTAQKRAQNVQDVPIAVSAIGGDALKVRGISDVSNLASAIPSLQVTTPYGKTQPNFSLRGVSVANEFAASTASPIGVYVDEVYQSFRASHGQQLFDIDRVEVLRGPQGTLYGRNTTGGAISFFTRRPSLGSAPEGYLTLGYGNYDTRTAEGAVEATLIPEKLGLRVAGTYAKGDGWLYNPVQRRDMGTINNFAGRATLRWRASSDLDVTFKIYGAKDNLIGAAAYGFGQLAEGRDALGYSRFDPAQNGGRALGRNEVSADTNGRLFTQSIGGALTVAWDVADRLTLTSITGYDEGKYRNAPADCDGSPNNLCAISYFSKSTNFNQDVRLTYAGSKLNATFGLYYGKDVVDSRNRPDFFGVLRPILLGAGLPAGYGNPAIATPDSIAIIPAFAANPALSPGSPGFCAPIAINPRGFLDARSLLALLTDISINNSGGGGFGGVYSAGCRAAGAPPFGPILGEQRYTIARPSKAIYADASYKLTDALTVTLGVRYTMDDVNYRDGRTTIFNLAGTAPIISTIPYSFPYNPALPAYRQSESANRLTGRANVSYDFAKEIMGYVNYSRGYRAGSFNGLAYQGLNQVYYIKPEKVDAYEAGLKMRFFDRRVQLNLAAFFYDYTNQQFTQVVGATTFTRSGNGRLFGGEAELTVKASDRLRFDASLGLLDTKYRGNTADATDPTRPTLPINGNPFPFASPVTFTGGFDYDLVKAERGRLIVHGDTSYTGKYFFDPFKNYGQSPCDRTAPGFNILQAGPNVACGNPGYWLFNGRITYDTPRFAIAVWGKNLANKYYYSYGLNINVFGLDYLNRGMPRTYGLEATVKF